MSKYQLVTQPGEGWRGRMSFIAQLLRHVFHIPQHPAPELQPVVEELDEVVLPPRGAPILNAFACQRARSAIRPSSSAISGSMAARSAAPDAISRRAWWSRSSQ